MRVVFIICASAYFTAFICWMCRCMNPILAQSTINLLVFGKKRCAAATVDVRLDYPATHTPRSDVSSFRWREKRHRDRHICRAYRFPPLGAHRSVTRVRPWRKDWDHVAFDPSPSSRNARPVRPPPIHIHPVCFYCSSIWSPIRGGGLPVSTRER